VPALRRRSLNAAQAIDRGASKKENQA